MHNIILCDQKPFLTLTQAKKSYVQTYPIMQVWLLVKTKRYPTLESATVTSTKNQSTVPLRVSHYHQLLKERETLKKELSEV